MKKTHILLLVLFLSVLTIHAQQPKSLFYLTRSPDGVRSFYAHADKIDILVPTWYEVDGDGLVSGGPDPAVLASLRVRLRPEVVALSEHLGRDLVSLWGY